MSFKNVYRLWCSKVEDAELSAELESIRDNDQEIEERFSTALEFGTAGLRGVMGAGTARLNIYTVRWATKGLADYINERYGGGSVAIAYDSRINSERFAKEAASLLAQNGIQCYIYPELMPVPALSFAVRELKTKVGIMITASHNPAKYNGYKVYGSDGCQMTLEDADAVLTRIRRVDMFRDTAVADFEEAVADGRIQYIGKRLIERYYQAVEAQQVHPEICRRHPIKLVYTPLNGAGNVPVRRVLDDIGVQQIVVVAQQEQPDGNFPTCNYPNPEMREALSLGLELCEAERPDIMIATDPDCDRIGVAVRDRGEYRILTGNEVGVLLLHYICRVRSELGKMPEAPVAVCSVVSSALADAVAKKYGVEMRRVLPGFKFIGEQVLLLEQEGCEDRFVFGFEESCGYLAGGYVRDKDGVLAAMLVCEMTGYYKQKNRTLIQILDELYVEFGYYRHEVMSLSFDFPGGKKLMAKTMEQIYAADIREFADVAVSFRRDYLAGIGTDLSSGDQMPIGLPSSDILELVLENGAQVMIRPSGTEPKIKVYLTAKEKTEEESVQMLEKLKEAVSVLLEKKTK